MGHFALLMLAFALAMDAFAASVCEGLGRYAKMRGYRLQLACSFAFFQVLMPALGYLSGQHFGEKMQALDHWVALVLLGGIGSHMIYEAYKNEGCAVDTSSDFSLKARWKRLFLLATGTSIDAFAVGISFAFLQVNLVTAFLFIFVVTFLLSGVGVYLGERLSRRLQVYAEYVGGVLLVLVGVYICLDHLGFLPF